MYARDLDADGDEDILVASGRDDSITFFENDGDESFTKRVITSAADNARAVYADDVDGDGSIDVLSGSEDDDTVAWWKNDGSQVFTEAIITTLRNQPQCVQTASRPAAAERSRCAALKGGVRRGAARSASSSGAPFGSSTSHKGGGCSKKASHAFDGCRAACCCGGCGCCVCGCEPP